MLGPEDVRHLFALPLGPEVAADAFLQELEAALALLQLHGATLVGGQVQQLRGRGPERTCSVTSACFFSGRAWSSGREAWPCGLCQGR